MPARDDEGRDEALARSMVYKDLSGAFRYPHEDTWTPLLDGSLREALEKVLGSGDELAGPLATSLARLEREGEGLDLAELQARYMEAFDIGWPEPPCPPNEGLHNEGVPRRRLLLDLASLYRHFGLKVGEQPETSQLADHLAIELEFLHFLSFKEGQALEEGENDLVAGYRRAQGDFLDHHPGRWVHVFAAKAREHASPTLAALADLTAGVIETERARGLSGPEEDSDSPH